MLRSAVHLILLIAALGMALVVGLVGCMMLNNPPTVIVDVSTTRGPAPLEVCFDASGSFDDGGIVSYRWSFEDGTSGYEPICVKLFPYVGSHRVELAVRDGYGVKNTWSCYITVIACAVGDPVYCGDPPGYGQVVRADGEGGAVLVRFFSLGRERASFGQWVGYENIEVLRPYERRALQSVPADYYDVHPYPVYPNTLEGLQAFLGTFRQLEKYKVGVYDCSEMTAYLEWALTGSGFDAYIASGPTPWAAEDMWSRHAWVLVWTQDGRYAVEATSPAFAPRGALGLVDEDDPYASGYFQGWELLDATIYDRVRYNGSYEFDWWEFSEVL